MSNTSGTEPFKMRIPSPGPDLTGRRLAKEVPDDPNRTGSIYADQFLAHKCPAHFDEVQRRQFFCILDLRRLKYAADEIFAKKDWKLNILNFAKEYEKSRGLIMLRYGLYEFKNVKPSNEVLKKWRSAHGLPPGPEEGQTPSRQSRQTPAPPGSVKRKAEEDSVPKDNALMASTANRNKRRNIAQEVAGPILAVPASFKSKRKADETDEIDENKPSKQQKSTPSAATTFLENILNKSRNGGASPSKQSSQATSLFGISKTKDSQNASAANKANPFEPVNSSLLFGPPKANSAGTSSGSVLSGHKIGSTPENTGNIFRYLSASPSSSSDDEDDDVDDHKSQPEPEQNSEEQSPSAGITTNTSTPPVHDGSSAFVVDKTNNTSDIFGRLSKSTSQSARGGLFGRVQMGANGHPVRADPSLDKKQDAPVNQPSTTKEQAAKTPAQTPVFGGKSATPKPAASFTFGQQTSSTPKATPSLQGRGMFGHSISSTPKAAPSPQGPDSSFPAPSSIGTTPINGTPEPQSPRDDGEEAVQGQIKLTEGGPGEEDEIILHEVRAKVLKFISVDKRDEDKQTAPWVTQGVGPLRVLKNKTTGTVRIVLRAEPRGHIAINKTILADMEYKAKEKTINLVATSEDGAGLETWLLQVKKPELALELAGVLEANKSANKQ
ncbi:hypothetical protein F5B18DRAFT_664809 [Nemania serpens]|nr:hypothetical protein F5B18DRAFT_664809 [Nemania serpens]